MHPISYVVFLVNSVQVIQADRHNREYDRLSKDACGYNTETVSAGLYKDIASKKPLVTLLEGTEPDVRDYHGSFAADVAAAYYKVSSPGAFGAWINGHSIGQWTSCPEEVR